jgi:hypothetical protein
MSMLGRRLSALEEVAETARRRELRDLLRSMPEAADLTPAETDEVVSMAVRLRQRYDTWQRAGLGVREIYYRLSDELGVSSEKIEVAFRNAAASETRDHV